MLAPERQGKRTQAGSSPHGIRLNQPMCQWHMRGCPGRPVCMAKVLCMAPLPEATCRTVKAAACEVTLTAFPLHIRLS